MICAFLSGVAQRLIKSGFWLEREVPNRCQPELRRRWDRIGSILLLILATVVCLALVFGLGGCSGVQMNERYSNLLDKTAALSAETATRARAGTLPEEQKTQALEAQAKTWKYFQDARDGKSSAPE